MIAKRGHAAEPWSEAVARAARERSEQERETHHREARRSQAIRARSERHAAGMRTHLQGTFLLIVLLLVFWWTLGWAAPILDGALFGDDGAVVARAPSEDEPAEAGPDAPTDEPLDGNEIAALQSALSQVGYSPGPVDGIMGELTRSAADEAKTDLGLTTESDRKLLATLESALETLESVSES